MINQHLTEIGIGFAGAYLIIKLVFEFLKARRHSEISSVLEVLAKLQQSVLASSHKIDELHSWHNVNDDEGMKVWYNRKSLENAITQLSNNIGLQTEILQKMVTNFSLLDQKIDQKLSGN